MNNIAIITARGGSKRIPQKNIRSFCGNPIIFYSIKAALDSGCFEEVMVSTDNEEIANISIKLGAHVPFLRSEKNSNDFSTTVDVLIEVIQKYEQMNINFTNACCLYPTAPFINASKLHSSYNKLIQSNYSSIVSVVQYSFPPQRSLIMKNNFIEYWIPKYQEKRSQDLAPLYHDAGQFYWFNVINFKKYNSLFTDSTGYFECSELEVQDIDNETDWKLAELKFQLINN